MTIALGDRGIGGVVLDIEGTTTPIAFVYDVLFPYARAHLRDYLAAHRRDDVMGLLLEEHTADVAAGHAPPPADPIEPYVEWLMDLDRKSPGLKRLQGLIWELGYADNTLSSDVFPDVPPALERWRADGIAVAIYSSGSVLAQRLLFGHTPAGDLTPFIGAFFDTAVGPKRDAGSYRRIAEAMALPPGALLFISDIGEELAAARTAGLQTALCVRPGNAAQPAGNDTIIQSLDEITP